MLQDILNIPLVPENANLAIMYTSDILIILPAQAKLAAATKEGELQLQRTPCQDGRAGLVCKAGLRSKQDRDSPLWKHHRVERHFKLLFAF